MEWNGLIHFRLRKVLCCGGISSEICDPHLNPDFESCWHEDMSTSLSPWKTHGWDM